MKPLNYLGIAILVVGAIILIYLGFAGTGRSNVLLGVGFVLVLAGFITHIVIDKKLNSLPEEER